MTQLNLSLSVEDQILEQCRRQGINAASVERRDYPEETIFILKVDESGFLAANELVNGLDHTLQANGVKGFITVKKVGGPKATLGGSLKGGVQEGRVHALATLLTARSRTSEFQPSIDYIADSASSIKSIVARRHHLIFGRRGVGKTALMVEAKQRVTQSGSVAVWINLQTLRLESTGRAFVYIAQKICENISAHFNRVGRTPAFLAKVGQLSDDLDRLSRQNDISNKELGRLVPRCQSIIERFTQTASCSLFIFIDELHYFKRISQPELIDALHGIVRDSDAWLKIAGIRHLSRWFQSHPPVGLQIGHDADPIDLDITLENPSSAKAFLEKILLSYAKLEGINTLPSFIMSEALDRLVLASGAVPRDYLVLCSDAIRQAQRRERAKLVGVQDVNKAAGEAAKVKLSELEDDASSHRSATLISTLNSIRTFCLDQKRFTFFRVDFQDKELYTEAYSFIQDLMDLRLLHLIDSSLSDEHEAGRRAEVYMLDLSQFSGQRLKKNLRALDFQEGHLVMKETGTATAAKLGVSSKQRLAILRRSPVYPLSVAATAEVKPAKMAKKKHKARIHKVVKSTKDERDLSEMPQVEQAPV